MAGDLDGDGAPDLLIDLDRYTDEEAPGPQPGVWEPRAAGGTLKLDSALIATYADLNGDVCADLVTIPQQYWFEESDDDDADAAPSELQLTTYLGSTAGPTNPVVAAGPQVMIRAVDDESYSIQGIAAIMTAGGTEVILTGLSQYEWSSSEQETVHVITLNQERQTKSLQTIALRDHGLKSYSGSEKVQLTLVASPELVAVGHTGEIVSGKRNAGAVYLFTPKASKPGQLKFSQRITQGANGVADQAETDDMFGYSLAMLDGRLAIGAPGEQTGAVVAAGLVQTMEWRKGKLLPGRAIRQGADGVPGESEMVDNFGEILAMARGLTAPDSYDIAIGTPMENDEQRRDVGALTITNFSEAEYLRLTPADTGGQLVDERQTFFASGLTTSIDPANGKPRLLVMSNGGLNQGCGGFEGNIIAAEAGQLSKTTRWETLRTSCEVGHELEPGERTWSAEGDLRFGWVPAKYGVLTED